MFFKKKGGDDGTAKDQPAGFSPAPTPASDDLAAKGASMTQQKPPTPAFNPEVPKRVVDIPGAPRRVDQVRKPDGETKRLTVGRDIILSGEITSCDVLVVEGRVEATLSNSHAIEISSTGHFNACGENVAAGAVCRNIRPASPCRVERDDRRRSGAQSRPPPGHAGPSGSLHRQ